MNAPLVSWAYLSSLLGGFAVAPEENPPFGDALTSSFLSFQEKKNNSVFHELILHELLGLD